MRPNPFSIRCVSSAKAFKFRVSQRKRATVSQILKHRLSLFNAIGRGKHELLLEIQRYKIKRSKAPVDLVNGQR
jgi:hypothetical protein